MPRALIVYYSRGGATRKMADAVAQGLKNENISHVLRGMAADIKRLFDESVRCHGKLDGKVGAAFSWQGDHYGPVSIGSPDARAEKECVRWGARTALLMKRLAG